MSSSALLDILLSFYEKGNLTCKTRFGSPVFWDNCFRSFASGLWFIAKYDFIVRNWWCLNDVRIRFVRDDELPMLPRPKPISIYSGFKSGKKDKEIKNYKMHFATRSEIADNISFSLSYDLLWFDHYLIKHLLSLLCLRRSGELSWGSKIHEMLLCPTK